MLGRKCWARGIVGRGGQRAGLTACFTHPIHQCVEEGVLVNVIVFHAVGYFKLTFKIQGLRC